MREKSCNWIQHHLHLTFSTGFFSSSFSSKQYLQQKWGRRQLFPENTASQSVLVFFKLFNLVEVAESSLKVLSLLPSMHLDAALFRAVSSSVCNLHFPCGSNKNISIISRSFITRSPLWHLLTTVASCVPNWSRVSFTTERSALDKCQHFHAGQQNCSHISEVVKVVTKPECHTHWSHRPVWLRVVNSGENETRQIQKRHNEHYVGTHFNTQPFHSTNKMCRNKQLQSEQRCC